MIRQNYEIDTPNCDLFGISFDPLVVSKLFEGNQAIDVMLCTMYISTLTPTLMPTIFSGD